MEAQADLEILPERRSAWGAGLAIARYRAHRYLPGGMAWATSHVLPLLTGLILKAVFDALSQHQPATNDALSWLAVLAGAEVARALVFWTAMISWPSWWQGIVTWLRANALSSILLAPGPPSDRLPGSAGEAVSRLRDDVEDLVWFVDVWVDLTGGIVFTVVALVVMLRISPVITLMVMLPLGGVVAGTRALSHVIRRYHRRMRESGAAVTDLIADLFAGVRTIKTAGAEERALERFRARNANRRLAAMRAQLARDLINSVSGVSIGISTGLVLLLSAGAMRQGRFTVGDLALFVSYADALTGMPRWLGRMIARQREAGVAMGRLARLQPRGRYEEVLAPSPVYFRTEPPPASPMRSDLEPLERLEIRDLTVRYPTGGGVQHVDLRIDPGSLVVVTGPVGSGKTTLLRAALGLIAGESGVLFWNGKEVTDPSSALVPPRVAYVAQIPRLISVSIEENLTLGWPSVASDLDLAIAVAQLTSDVEEMAQGMATVVGPRGSRLSGGQVQRAAVARALVRRPDLMVIDDISSALDPPTEMDLWISLRARGGALLAASHRRHVLEMADWILVLDRGHVAAAGVFNEVLPALTATRSDSS